MAKTQPINLKITAPSEKQIMEAWHRSKATFIEEMKTRIRIKVAINKDKDG